MTRASSRKLPDSETGARVDWAVVLWTVVAVGVVTWVLPRGRETRSAPSETKAPLAVSELANLGNLAMREVSSDPAAIDRALNHYRRGNAQDPGHLTAQFGLAFAGQVKGLPDSEWRGLYQKTVSEASLLAFLSLFNLAHAEQEAGRYPEALGLLQQAVRVMPERADGWFALARVHAALGHDAEASYARSRGNELAPGSRNPIESANARAR